MPTPVSFSLSATHRSHLTLPLACLPTAFGAAATGFLPAFALSACLARFAALTSRRAASRAAARCSGFWLFLALITSRLAPTYARCPLLFPDFLRLDTSSVRPFLCRRR